ncbi:MAG: F0F1 ATP synthase subunit delta [Verrucomicrobia bacterium]|nr:F0F1 ATP synthase subunit delta [Verrucomicrobiota bacterium]MDA1087777.1 F0F1 ATP synthase subunit delta [Verrucomicrobiota bacterium]
MHTVLIMLLGLQLVVFGVIVFLFKRLLLRDAMNAVNRIKQVEADVNKREEAVRRQLEDHEKELAHKLTEMEAELERRRVGSEQELVRMKETITAEAKREGEEIVARAKRGAQKMREDMEREAEARAIDYAGDIFKMTFSEKVSESVNREFVGEVIAALEEVDGESLHVEAGDAEFTSSHPLAPDQRRRLQDLISEKFSVSLDIQEKVDPEILGGISMRIGTLEIDASLRSRFSEAAGEVKKDAGAT